jgi:16S rRNA (cytidine1402-2'-O)-methyltransferase
MLGKLYIVATPIGNLEDITRRALRVLKEVDLVLAEDTRKTGILLRYYDMKKPIMSYHQHSQDAKRLKILRYLVDGKDLALVSDAGTPGISDPGNELIDFLLEKEPKIKIIPVPGPSALTATLSVCGFKVNRFMFIGFLPKKKRSKLFDWLKQGKVSFAFYESPRRILKTLAFLEEQMGGERRICIARELTKLHETLYRGRLSEVRAQIERGNIKGEIVVVVEEK